MPNVSFTQYRNELARVLGTRQHSVKQFQVNLFQFQLWELSLRRRSNLYLNLSTSKRRRSVLNPLRLRISHTKLDGAIAENTQIWELLNPATFATAFTNALCRLLNSGHMGLEVSFWGRNENQSLQQAKMG